MIISILLILLGIGGIGIGAMMFGDIGIAAMIGGGTALLSGMGFYRTNKRLTSIEQIGSA